MGRSRKPLEMQKGNITNFEKAKKEEEAKAVKTGTEQLRLAPEWLREDEIAIKEWRRIMPQLKKIDIIGNLDRANIAGYCYYYAQFVRTTMQLAEESPTIEIEHKNHTSMQVNPLITLQKEYADQMRKFAGLCGMTIDSRLKAAVVKTTKKEQEIESKFGGV